MENKQEIHLEEAKKLIGEMVNEGYSLSYDADLHKLFFENEINKERWAMRLALDWVYSDAKSIIEHNPIDLLVCIIQSDSAVIGSVSNAKVVAHKSFAAYMSRKKQGKSQIKYLKTKGKSKAGSRVRLASTYRFFEHINEKMTEYMHKKAPHKIAFSCSKTLIPYLYDSKIACPFDKKDQRLYKIPKDLPSPNLKVLEHVCHFLHHASLVKL